MKNKILVFILTVTSFITLFFTGFIVGFQSSQSLKSASAEYYNPLTAGFLIDNSEFYNANFLNVSGQTFNTSDRGFQYVDNTTFSLSTSVLSGRVLCNGNIYSGNNNSMRLNYNQSKQWDNLYITAIVSGVNTSGSVRCALLDGGGNFVDYQYFYVEENSPTIIRLSFNNLDFTGYLFLQMGWWDSPTITTGVNFFSLTNFLITEFPSDVSNFRPSYSDLAYFQALDNYVDGKYTGYRDGYATGFDEALDVGEVSSGNFFSRVLDILDVKIFGFVSLGDIFKVLFGVSIVIILLKLFAGG